MFKIIFISLIVAIWVLAVLYGYGIYIEAYGEGAPYYGKATNVDKWENPLPLLVFVFIAAAAATVPLRIIYIKLNKAA